MKNLFSKPQHITNVLREPLNYKGNVVQPENPMYSVIDSFGNCTHKHTHLVPDGPDDVREECLLCGL